MNLTITATLGFASSDTQASKKQINGLDEAEGGIQGISNAQATGATTESEQAKGDDAAQASFKAPGSSQSGGVNIAVATILKRIQELVKQLREQQQQLQELSRQKFSSEEIKLTAIMGAQELVSSTSAALQSATSELSQALSKNPISTTA